MEKHPIEIWDHLVFHALYPSKLKTALPDQGVKSYLEESNEAREEARSVILREGFHCKTEEECKMLVRHYQTFFTNLMAQVCSYESEADLPAEGLKIYEQVKHNLDTLIWFLERTFAEYFDRNYKVPAFMREQFEKEMKHLLAKVSPYLREEGNRHSGEALLSILENAIRSNGISFHQLDYFKKLRDKISNWNAEPFSHPKFTPFIAFLIAFKFNEEGFMQLVTKVITEDVFGAESEEEQFRLLKEYYKSTSQILEYNNPPFCPDHSSPKNVILDWLSQEIHYFETRYPKKENTPTTTSSKINTSLSVPVLALYMRLFKEEGIITNSNHSELFRAVSSVFTTHRKADVAQSHLHSKFYAIEESARRKVFEQLMSMAHLCKRLA